MAEQDTPARPGPALSATSDTPEIQADPPPLSATGWQQGDPPETPAEDAPAEVTEPPAEGGDEAPPETPAEGEEPPAETVETTAKRRPDQGVGKKLNELEAAKAESDRKAAEEKGRADELARQLEAERTRKETRPDDEKPAEEAKPPQDLDPRPARPKRADFETPDAYEDARDQFAEDLSGWTLREAERARITDADKRAAAEAAKVAEESKRATTDAEFTKTLTAHQERRTKAIEARPDFVEVAENPDVQVSVPMAQVIMQSDIGPDIMYYLGQNPAEAARIAALVIPGQVFPDKWPNGQPCPVAGKPIPDERAQLIAMGEITARVRGTPAPLVPEKKPVSKTPAPVKAVAQRGTGNQKTAEEKSGDEYYNDHPTTKAKQAAANRAGATTH